MSRTIFVPHYSQLLMSSKNDVYEAKDGCIWKKVHGKYKDEDDNFTSIIIENGLVL